MIRPLVLCTALVGCGILGGDTRATSAAGSVCGSPEIIGTRIDPIDGPGACGIADPVRISRVGGVEMSAHARVDCTTARAFLRWIKQGAKPAVGSRGGGIAQMRVMASYACRSRNSRPGARLSEHALGHAIDVGGVTLKNGEIISVLDDWGQGSKGQILREMHSSACGPFGTVLGPQSDRYHQDHFHFDTARYRSGPYCR